MPKTYQGSCHCGATGFEVTAEIDHMRVCDCSICRKRGALNFRVPKEALQMLTPLEDMTVYRWGTMTGADYFCPHCGISPFRRPSAPTEKELAAGATRFEGWAINLRCLEGVDLEALPVVTIKGSAL
ncbi:GFA family protein [Celeribacter sp. HF31]|uniref:GFA family protein n=1 Tax=Celeribacter sp. HF31 TaxID=2721558 RepID=UPI00142FD215|nr:GFA family protein [Celeribacter sp. HF31]NIY79740.1 GFA family protein [Celeribacter sp. HF31]